MSQNKRPDTAPTSTLDARSVPGEDSLVSGFSNHHLHKFLQDLPLSAVIYHAEERHPSRLRIMYLNTMASKEGDGILEQSEGKYLCEVVPGLLDDAKEDGMLWGLVQVALDHNPPKRTYEYPSAVGTIGWFLVHVVQLAPGYVAALYEEITPRKQTELSLRESEERFRSTFAQAAVGLAHIAPDGRFVRANQRCIQLLGYPEDELLGRTFQSITHPQDLQAGTKGLRQVLHQEIPFFSMEKRYICKDGSIVWSNLTTSPVFAEDGSTQYMVSVIEDISDRKRIEESLAHHMKELARSNRDLNEFVNMTAHGMHRPLQAIEAQVNILTAQGQGQLTQEATSSLQLLQGRVEQLAQRLRGLQRYAQIGRTRHPLDLVNVSDLLQDLTTLLAIPDTFTIAVQPPLPTLLTHRALLEQVFQILLLNAHQHHDKRQGTIEVSARQSDDFYEFCVRDDGPGIPTQKADAIFRIFGDEEAQSKAPFAIGIGLAIAQKCVQQQGGRIWVESKSERGCAFYFEWPITMNASTDPETL